MKRILLIGSGGAGKSTLAVKLGQILNYPVIHLDKLYWKGEWEHLESEVFDQVLEEELVKPYWIIDGNFDRTIPNRLKYSDTVIYLDYSPILCALGVLKRVAKNYGKTRVDMGGQCKERFDLSFLRWVITFRKEKQQKYMQLLEESHCEVIVLKNRRQARKYLEQIKEKV